MYTIANVFSQKPVPVFRAKKGASFLSGLMVIKNLVPRISLALLCPVAAGSLKTREFKLYKMVN
jgi:hypothetical protein